MGFDMKFRYNGIRIDGKLYKAHYSKYFPMDSVEDSIIIRARVYGSFPNIDVATGFFNNDELKIKKGDFLYKEANEAYLKQQAKKQMRKGVHNG